MNHNASAMIVGSGILEKAVHPRAFDGDFVHSSPTSPGPSNLPSGETILPLSVTSALFMRTNHPPHFCSLDVGHENSSRRSWEAALERTVEQTDDSASLGSAIAYPQPSSAQRINVNTI